MGKTYHYHSELEHDNSIYEHLSDEELDLTLNGNLQAELENLVYRTRKNASKHRRHDKPDIK